MNDATVLGVTDRVAAYVREVRAELADLPMDDVDPHRGYGGRPDRAGHGVRG
jgi:hypothetical protein